MVSVLLYLLKNIAASAFFVLFGAGECIVCGLSFSHRPLCSKCESRYLYSRQDGIRRCSVCSRYLLSENNTPVCMSCRQNRILVSPDGVFSIIPYRMWAKNLLFEWKMQSSRSLSSVFAKAVYYEAEKKFGIVDAVIPVPPRPGKIREKGWDQIDELCSILKKRWSMNVLKLLERTGSDQQKKLDYQGRIENSLKSYRLSEKGRKLCKKGKMPESVLLVDDVQTTGVTVNTCASILKEAGCKKVYVLTLFLVD